MLPVDAQIISVDDHVIEHPRVWLDRVASNYAADAPRIERVADGNDAWIFEGQVAGDFALNAVVRMDRKDWGRDRRTYDDMRPGCHDLVDHLRDMDEEGVVAGLSDARWS
jgi:hypothetical protein